MKRFKWLILVACLLFVLFVPAIPVNVVPEWQLRLIDESGHPVPNAKVEQMWKDYSLEFYRFPHLEEPSSSDANGIVAFPARNIRISISQAIAARLLDFITSINPHAGYGPHSYVQCRGSISCNATFMPEEERPRVVVVKR